MSVATPGSSRRNPFNGDAPLTINAEFDISENHFPKEGVAGFSGSFGLSNAEELDLAINDCTEQIKKCPETERDRKKTLVKRLIELRIALNDLKEGISLKNTEDTLIVSGHVFRRRNESSQNRYCERCCSIIWVLVQHWLRCDGCGYSCHYKCVTLVKRECAKLRAPDQSQFTLQVCPEVGLEEQKYRCAECNLKLSFDQTTSTDASEPRLCDYTGLYYCPACHWNDEVVIPARVANNWDFQPRRVARANKQYIRLVVRRPFIDLERVNPRLFNHVDELRIIRKYRRDILMIKVYFLSCKDARRQRLLTKLSSRQHFVESSELYSLQDLIDVKTGSLELELIPIMDSFLQHIKLDCETCRGNGFICEVCRAEDVLFPFDDYIDICSACLAVFHRLCFAKQNRKCPRCVRWRIRQSQSAIPVSTPIAPPAKSPPTTAQPEPAAASDSSLKRASENSWKVIDESLDAVEIEEEQFELSLENGVHGSQKEVVPRSGNPFEEGDTNPFGEDYEDELNPFANDS